MQNGVVGDAYDRDGVVANVAASSTGRAPRTSTSSGSSTAATRLPRDSERWQYVPELVRDEAEPLVHKSWGDSFEETDLESVLAERGVGRLVVAGAQTDECIRSTLHGRDRPRLRRDPRRGRPHHRGPLGVRRAARPTWSSRTRTSTGRTTPRPAGRAGTVDTGDVDFGAVSE